ncbi:ras-related protein Rab-40C-like [Pundamilia nyererei]|uniref:Ras-related protein Rab-40C-like n=1 Tax=Pundamilia nyererei TaxID=303518 RepID=A0A9Y6JEB4_9CICH|nr:PREDICTED: ras-related protein Rab-40C-like [Pundamilia nyererei]
MRGMMGTQSSPVKSYDYLLKFLLVGDSDVGKGEILDSLQDGSVESPYAYSSVFSLQDLCCRSIVSCTPVHLIDKLPLPVAIKSHLKSFSMANGMNAVMMHGRSYSVANSAASGGSGGGSKANSLKRSKSFRPPQSPPKSSSLSPKGNCKIS